MQKQQIQLNNTGTGVEGGQEQNQLKYEATISISCFRREEKSIEKPEYEQTVPFYVNNKSLLCFFYLEYFFLPLLGVCMCVGAGGRGVHINCMASGCLPSFIILSENFLQALLLLVK